MTSETVYSVELVSRMTYLSANSLRGTYTGTLRRNVPSISVTTRECPFSVRLAGGVNRRVRGGPKAIPLFSAGCHSLFLAASQVPGQYLVLITTVWGTLLVELIAG